MSARIAFVDCETTSLRPDRRAWEIALIARENGEDTEHLWMIDIDHLDLANADLIALKIGRFHERHPQMQLNGVATWDEVEDEPDALAEIEVITRGAHLVGAVPSFDAEVLSARMRANGICPSFHYHLIDVETLAIGWLQRHAAYLENRASSLDEARRLRELARPPWKSDDLAAAMGLPPASEDARHTAMGDARFARAIYDAVMVTP